MFPQRPVRRLGRYSEQMGWLRKATCVGVLLSVSQIVTDIPAALAAGMSVFLFGPIAWGPIHLASGKSGGDDGDPPRLRLPVGERERRARLCRRRRHLCRPDTRDPGAVRRQA